MTFDAHPRSSLIVALDFDSLNSAVKFAKQIADLVGMFKIGSQLFTAAGPAAVREVSALGPGIFLDLKFHDIPNTVAGAVLVLRRDDRRAARQRARARWHAMLHAAVQAISAGQPMGADRPRLARRHSPDEHGSENDARSRNRWTAANPRSETREAGEDRRSGRRRCVSVQEARAIRKACGRDFLIVTPGVRPTTKDAATAKKTDDQARTATPTEAIKAGADFLVVGRPITAAADPRAAAQAIVDEIAAAK